MAILKHIASKNADYGEAERYLIFQYNEYTGKPILDQNKKMIPREEYLIDGIHCNPYTFDIECRELNALYHKNQNYDDIKSHHYILSFDPKDKTENKLTCEHAQQLGIEFATKNFPGHQALVCTHTDGHNQSGNIHVHIIINSLRKYDVERQDFMERPCDSLAGYKHHLSKPYLIYLKQSLMDICHREKLHQVDLLNPARQKITEKEYWVKRRGQEKLKQQTSQKDTNYAITQRTPFQTQKDYLRNAIQSSVAHACSLEEFQQQLLDKYHVKLHISRGRFSYLHPERTRNITGRQLGADYKEDYIIKVIQENAEQQNTKNQKYKSGTKPSFPEPETAPSTLHYEQMIFIQSDLQLVVDLQSCIKAQQNTAYARKVKLSNLKEMAKTIAYIQENGYNTKTSLEQDLLKAKIQSINARKTLKSTEEKLRNINEQIHFTGQYLANKSTYTQFLKAANKATFRQKHSAEITLYETAVKILKEKGKDGKLPSMKLLKEEKEKLLQQKKLDKEHYQTCQEYQKHLNIICSNIDKILDKTYEVKEPQQSIELS